MEMSKMKKHPTSVKEESRKSDPSAHFSADLQELKTSFGKLRDDVAGLLANASGTAKSGVGQLKDRGGESIDRVEGEVSQRPLLRLSLAMVVGFILTIVLTKRR